MDTLLINWFVSALIKYLLFPHQFNIMVFKIKLSIIQYILKYVNILYRNE